MRMIAARCLFSNVRSFNRAFQRLESRSHDEIPRGDEEPVIADDRGACRSRRPNGGQDNYGTLTAQIRGRNSVKKKSAIPQLTPAQAHYVLVQAVADRKLSYNDIVSYLARIQDEVRELEARLEQLRAAAPPVVAAPPAEKPADDARPKAARARHRAPKPITPKRRASMKLQGQYLGLLQRVPEAKKAEIKKIAQEKGREAAIKQMRAARPR